MVAFITVIVLQAVVMALAIFVVTARFALEAAGKYNFKPEPISFGYKIFQSLLMIGWCTLVYNATVGTFVGNFPAVVFLIQVTTTAFLFMKNLPKKMTSDKLTKGAIALSFSYAVILLGVYGYMGLYLDRVAG